MTTECTMEVILNWLNLQEAIEAVKRNKGAAGVDGKSITETEQHIGEHWPKIEAKLMAGSYVPSDIKGVENGSVQKSVSFS